MAGNTLPTMRGMNSLYQQTTAFVGQPDLPIYDVYQQVAMMPELKTMQGSVIAYKPTNLTDLLDYMTSKLGMTTSVYKTNEHWFSYYTAQASFALAVNAGVAAGTTVTVTIKNVNNCYSSNGTKSLPQVGTTAFIKGATMQKVNITAKNVTTNFAHTITLTSINNEVIDLLAGGTLVIAPVKEVAPSVLTDMTIGATLVSMPALKQSWLYQEEDREDISHSALNGYNFTDLFRIEKGLNPLTSEPVDCYYSLLHDSVIEKLAASRGVKVLDNKRDYVNNAGFDGAFTTIRAEGGFNVMYNKAVKMDIIAEFRSIIRNVRQKQIVNNYMLLEDPEFMFMWNDSVADLITRYGQNVNYGLFGAGGEGNRKIEYFNFDAFKYDNVTLTTFQADIFDNPQYGQAWKGYGCMFPSEGYKATTGKMVAPIQMTSIEGCTENGNQMTWIYDWQQQGGRTISFFGKVIYGVDTYSPQNMGLWQPVNC